MRVSLDPLNNETRKTAAIIFLKRLLESPSISGWELPRAVRGTLYIDDVPHSIQPGSWAIDSNYIYMASTSPNVDQLTRIGILASLANMTGAIEDPTIVELLSNKLVTAIKESTLAVYSSFIKATAKPNKLAIDINNTRIAAELDGSWFSTGGVPTEVDDSWIVMDF